MKHGLHALFVMSALALGFGTAHASTQVLDAVEEINTGICLLVSQGAYTAAVERQAGTPKKQAQKVLEKELKTVEKNFSDKQFVRSLQSIWLSGLDIVYQAPIQQTQADKQAFIEEVVSASLMACLDDMESGF
ncbi:MAG: hypothetical protein Q4A69_08560 [Moraxella sp.]|nr:hypothetical protein [Moraxella sp.]